MKSKNITQSERAVNNTQSRITGTKSVRNRPAEFPAQNPTSRASWRQFDAGHSRTLKLAQLNLDAFRPEFKGQQREAL